MSYTIAGKKILTEHLVLGVFGAYGGLYYLSTRGGSSATQATPSAAAGGATAGPKTNGPEFGAGSSEEESFIRQFIAEAEGDKNPQRQV